VRNIKKVKGVAVLPVKSINDEVKDVLDDIIDKIASD
tara:strand:+ start:481 stop:591 length:111 start_codon:yes stop_codon:yes gene_type:complete